jgi:hypothetical protein
MCKKSNEMAMVVAVDRAVEVWARKEEARELMKQF